MMTQQVCIVTGASSGIGKEAALALACAGMHVVMICRSAEKGVAAQREIKLKSGSESVDLLLADLSSQAAIRSLASDIQARYPAIHILINNAGLAILKKEYSVDKIEMTLATNYVAPCMLTALLTDTLIKSAPSRVVNVSSASHTWAKLNLDDLQFERRKYGVMKAYAQSKLLLNIYSFALAKKLEASGVTVNCIHPGAVKTNLGSQNSGTLLLKVIEKIIKLFFISPAKAASYVVNLVLLPEMKSVTGKYFDKDKIVAASQVSYDEVVAEKLLGITNYLIK